MKLIQDLTPIVVPRSRKYFEKAQSIRNIECECANGLLYVTISYDKPEEEEIKIK